MFYASGDQFSYVNQFCVKYTRLLKICFVFVWDVNDYSAVSSQLVDCLHLINRGVPGILIKYVHNKKS